MVPVRRLVDIVENFLKDLGLSGYSGLPPNMGSYHVPNPSSCGFRLGL